MMDIRQLPGLTLLPLLLLLLLLSPTLLLLTQGEVVTSRNLEQVRRYGSKTGEVCIRPLLSRGVQVQLQLSVQSTYSHNTFPAGHTSLPPSLLSPFVWHSVDYSLVTVEYKYELAVSVDGKDVDFEREGQIFTSAFNFQEVTLLVKGRAEVSDCPPPPDPTTTTTTTTPLSGSGSSNTSSTNTTTQQQEVTTTPDGGGVMWSLGKVGAVPVLAIVLAAAGVVVLAALVAGMVVICRKKKKERKRRGRNTSIKSKGMKTTVSSMMRPEELGGGDDECKDEYYDEYNAMFQHLRSDYRPPTSPFE